MPVARSDHWPTVFNAIRAVHPTTPILILGGKTFDWTLVSSILTVPQAILIYVTVVCTLACLSSCVQLTVLCSAIRWSLHGSRERQVHGDSRYVVILRRCSLMLTQHLRLDE